MSIEPGVALDFALQGLFYFAAIRFATLLAVVANLPNDASREAELRWRLEHLDRWPAYIFTVAWLVYFGSALDRAEAWIAFAAGLSLVPVLWKKRFGRYDYGPSLAAYADGRVVYRRQIAWLSAASIFGMVLLFDLV